MAKKKAAAHHGGAWKVAYADFVTAMMALFMVLWISAQDNKILIATSQYFQNPFHSPMEATSGVLPFNSNKTTHSEGKDAGDAKEQSNNKQIQLSFLNSVASDFYRLLHLDENLEDKPIDIQVTSDGLRINLFDRARRPLFKDESAEFTEWGKFMMQNLAWMVDRHHFRVTIDGHTKTPATPPKSDDTAWELSTARANASRHLLVYYAVDPSLIERVTGYADTKPLPDEAPTSDSNQRVTLMLTMDSQKDQDKDKSKAPPGGPAPAPAVATAESYTPPHRFTPPFKVMKSFLEGKKSLAISPLVAAAGPTASAPAGAKNGHSHDSVSGGQKANVEIVKEGDKVVRIVVTCKCGERLEIECLYPAGS